MGEVASEGLYVERQPDDADEPLRWADHVRPPWHRGFDDEPDPEQRLFGGREEPPGALPYGAAFERASTANRVRARLPVGPGHEEENLFPSLRGPGGSIDVIDVVPIEHQGRTSFVEFEWIGTTDPLEPDSFLRGKKRTSIDALLLAKVPGGRRAYFMEWKYTESCGAKSYAVGRNREELVLSAAICRRWVSLGI